MDRGYFALWRKFEDHPFWKENRVFSKAEAWIDILWSAQWKKKPKKVALGMTVLTQNYGECLKSVNTWARRWGWSQSKVRRYFAFLEKKLKQIEVKSEGQTTRLTVLNYEQYDPKRRANGEQAVSKRRGSGEQAATNKKDKNVKKVKNIKKSARGEPSRLPSQNELSESSKKKLRTDTENLTEKLYDKKIFTKAHAFVNTMRKQQKNDRAILHTLSRCYLKGISGKLKSDSEAWAYCQKIMDVENGNYNESDHQKTV